MPVALVSLIRRNRRRYGGYLVHAGVAVLFIGIAASSSFQHVRDVRLAPGQSATVGGQTFTYQRPVAQLVAARNGRLERIDFGAVLHLSRNGHDEGTLRTVRSYFPSVAPLLGPVSRFFEGDAESQVGLRAGLRRDVWSAIQPDTSRLRPRIAEGDRVFRRAKDLTNAQASTFLAEALRGLTASYAKSPPPATFRLLISPMVTWIWLGALLAFLGGLICLWPTPRRGARLARAAYAARVGRDVRVRVPA